MKKLWVAIALFLLSCDNPSSCPPGCREEGTPNKPWCVPDVDNNDDNLGNMNVSDCEGGGPITMSTISDRMKDTLNHALRAEHDKGYSFKIADSRGVFTNETRSPLFSSAGQFHLTCANPLCRQTVFEDDTGTATMNVCATS